MNPEEKDEPPQKKSKEKPATKFAKFFRIEGDRDRERKAICLLCEKKEKTVYIKMTGRNTTGLRRHLGSSHKKEHDEMFEVAPSSQRALTDFSDFIKSTPSTSRMIEPSKIQKENFRATLVDWAAKKHLPLNFFDSNAQAVFDCYRNLGEPCTLPGKTAFTADVGKRYAELKVKVQELIKKNTSKFACTIDGWTSLAGLSYYGITLHYLDDEFSHKCLTLDFLPAQGKHCGKDIAKLFIKCLDDFKLRKRIVGITMDNVAANTTFMNELGLMDDDFGPDKHFRCMAHILNLGCQSLMATLEDNREPNLNVEYSCKDSCDEDDNEYEDESEEDKEDEEDIRAGTNGISKLRTIFKHVKRSEQLSQKLKKICEACDLKHVNPKIDCKTRWNSTHDMMAVGIQMKEAINTMCDSCKELSNKKISNEEWDILSEVTNFLNPFKKLTIQLSAETYSTLPTFILSFNWLIDKIETECHRLDGKPDRSAVDELLVTAYQCARDKMLKHYQKTNWIYCIALILDPRHKEETFEKTHWGKELKASSIRKFQEIFKNYEPLASAAVEICSSRSSSSSDDDYFGIFEKTKRSESDAYFAEPRAGKNEKIENWWKLHQNTYPVLARMARDYLCVPATSTPVERLFSQASLLIRRHRNRLSSENSRRLLCIRSWQELQ